MNIFNLKSDWVYWLVGAVLSGLLCIVVFYSLGFLVENFNTSLNADLIKSEPTVKFNLDKLKELGI